VATSLPLYWKLRVKLEEATAMKGSCTLPRRTVKLLSPRPTGAMVKTCPLREQVPAVAAQVVLPESVNSAGTVTTREVRLLRKLDWRVKGELTTSVRLEA
jgi:hypothetical protein